jgi:peroxiredoxin Q/BCP
MFKFGRMPAQVVIDRNGIARYVQYGKSMSDITKNKELIKLLEELNLEFNINI